MVGLIFKSLGTPLSLQVCVLKWLKTVVRQIIFIIHFYKYLSVVVQWFEPFSHPCCVNIKDTFSSYLSFFSMGLNKKREFKTLFVFCENKAYLTNCLTFSWSG